MKFFKRLLLKRMQEADLNQECALAASHYINTAAKGAPMVERQNMLNYVGVGFGMGIRWMESELGARKDKNDPAKRV